MLKTLLRGAAVASLLVAGAAYAQDSGSPVPGAQVGEGDTTVAPDGAMSGDAAMSSDMPMVGGAPMNPEDNIATNASKASNLTTLVAAVQAAGLVETLQGEGPFTVFAPTNEAFEALPAGTVDTLLMPENKDQLTGILTYHVVPAEATSAAAMQMIQDDGGEHAVTTVQGDQLILRMDGDNLTVTDAQGNTATVTQADVMQSNGVVHVIDTVLMPSS